ncbi:DUF4157 domain-containing protein [Fulvivirga imtechensis]|nr:DUF4157 domain-containing protein [Fulvivirga imtechensis]
MKARADNTQKNKSQSVANNSSQHKSGIATSQFIDNRPEAAVQRKLQALANNSQQVKQVAQLQAVMHDQQKPTLQKKENNTGLPDQLKSGIESLSGYAMDDVKVHYNSDKPSQLQAHAYAQGTEIHIAPGQEKHLPHEAWHVVQQKQGRVKPTTQLQGKINVNDDAGLEKEADVMGRRALNAPTQENENARLSAGGNSAYVAQRKVRLGFKPLNSINDIPEENRPELLALLNGQDGVTTLEGAFASKHTFWFRGKPGSYTLTIMEPEKEEEAKVEEGPKATSSISTSKPAVDTITYVAGDEIVFADSTTGSHHLEISGLIGCVGIILEKNSGSTIQVAATHLLDKHYTGGDTPTMDAGGYRVIDDLLARVGVSASAVGSGGVTMTLVVSGEVQIDKMRRLVSRYISEKGGEATDFGMPTSKVYYSVIPG